VDNIVKEHKDIFTSPTMVPLHGQVNHSIDLTPDDPLPNDPIFGRSTLQGTEGSPNYCSLFDLCEAVPKEGMILGDKFLSWANFPWFFPKK
jgi:hypothetical protein